MEESKVTVGSDYKMKSALFSHPFTGKIISKLEHSAIVEIQDCDSSDQGTAKDLQSKTVISYKDMSEK